MDSITKTIIKAIVETLKNKANYYNGNGVEMPMFIQNRYPQGAVSGVVLGNVSGGCFIVDDIQQGKQPHGTPYWLPCFSQEVLDLLEQEDLAPKPELEQFGDEPAIGLPPTPARATVANPSR